MNFINRLKCKLNLHDWYRRKVKLDIGYAYYLECKREGCDFQLIRLPRDLENLWIQR